MIFKMLYYPELRLLNKVKFGLDIMPNYRFNPRPLISKRVVLDEFR
jgi:hypothetical protein